MSRRKPSPSAMKVRPIFFILIVMYRYCDGAIEMIIPGTVHSA
jgi:hypothetical protein